MIIGIGFAAESAENREGDIYDYPCSIGNNQSFTSLLDALNSVTDNVMIDITSDVVLTSVIYLESLENVGTKIRL